MAYTQADVEDALRNADAAGDRQAARQLADELVRMQGTTKTAPVTQTSQPPPTPPPLLKTPEPAPRTTLGQTNFVAGNVNKFFADLLGMPVDMATDVLNLARAGVGTRAYEAGLIKAEDLPEMWDRSSSVGGSEWFKGLMHRAGVIPEVAEPRTGTERIVAAALENAPFALLGGGEQSAAQLIRSAVQAGTAGAAGQATAEAGGGPKAQLLAQALTPAVTRAPGAAAEALRRQTIGAGTDPLRAGVRVTERAQAAREAGVEQPSPGVVAGSRALQGAEASLAALPGSAGFMEETAKARTQGVREKIGEVTQRLAPGGIPSATDAGKAVRAGAIGKIEAFQATQAKLAAQAAAAVKPNQPIRMTETLKTLRDILKVTPGAEAVSTERGSAGMRRLAAKLESDLTPKAPKQTFGAQLAGQAKPTAPPRTDELPFSAADDVRKIVGDKLGSRTTMISEGLDEKELRRLYGAMLTDIENSLPAGQRRPWTRLRTYTKAGHDRIDNVLEPLLKRSENVPEKAVAAIMSGTKEGATNFDRVMRTLKPDQANLVRAHVIDELGKATPGAQTAAGDVFSIDTFVTNWDRLSPEARQVLFRDPRVRADMQNIAQVVSDMKAGSKVLYNPSGSARLIAHSGAVFSALGSFVTGALTLHPAAAVSGPAVVGGQMALSHSLARAMTSPQFIRWLAQGSKLPPNRTAQWMAQLGTLANNAKDPIERESFDDINQWVKTNLGGQSTDRPVVEIRGATRP